MSEEASHATRARRSISRRDFNRITLIVLAVGLAVLAALGATIVWLSAKTADFNGWVAHTYMAQQRIVAFQAAVERAETARRGYLLAPTPEQLATYQSARSEVSATLYQMAVTTSDNPAQRANIARIRPLITWKTKVNDDSVALVKAGHRSEALDAFPKEQSMQPLLGIRAVVADMVGEEQGLLESRKGHEQDAIALLVGVGLATAALLALLSLSAIWVMRRFATDLTLAQEELKQFNEALEQRVRERTADLTRANDEIQRFAYIVSHDLRSPLVNVMGFTSELEVGMKPVRALVRWVQERDVEHRMPPEILTAIDVDIPEAIGFIRSSTKKMDGLIGAILKLSREGRRVLNPERLSMSPLVRNVFNTVKHAIDEIGGEAVIDGPLPDIVSDRLAVEQILGNLVDNAVKYHSAKRPLRIAVRGSEQFGQVMIEVEDNGRGVAPKDHERIFELFRRAGAQTKPGEGIGLAHVRALAHRLGGTITVVSALDQGATFRLSLPKVLMTTEGTPA